MPLRSVKMKRFIFGFQRRVWCPKWTPLSSRFFMLTTATWRRPSSFVRGRPEAGPALLGCRGHPGGAPPWCPAAPPNPPRGRDRGGDCPAAAAGRGHAKSVRQRQTAARAYALAVGAPTGSSPARPPVHCRPPRPRPGGTPRQGRGMSAARLLAVLTVLASIIALPPASAAPPPDTARALWSRPLAGDPAVTRRFDVLPTPYAAGHRGVDLAGAPGQQVLAAGAGVVAFAGWVAGRPVVSVEHPGGLRTTYEPVQPGVGAGQVVARGTPLGVLVAGHAGCPVEACLHWGLRRGEVYLDPLSLLRPPRVRLLPWS